MSMSENELFIWLGFLTLFASIVLLWYITGKRKTYSSDISQRELGATRQINTIIYILLLIIIAGCLITEINFIAMFEPKRLTSRWLPI